MGNQLYILKLIRSPSFKKNSVICITGASSGIGKELAIQYSQRKCRLLLSGRNQNELEQVRDIGIKLGSQVEICVADVSLIRECKRIIDTCIEKFGELDLLVLCAGVNAHFKFEENEDLEIYEKIMKVNFFGYVFCTKFAWPHLKANKGQIIVLSSLSGEVGLPWRSAYCSSKFAVTGFFESLRIEQETKEVDITIICPPSVKTPMREKSLMKAHSGQVNYEEIDTRLPVEVCVKRILEASDRRGRKIFFPLKVYIGVYLRPFFPDFVDRLLKKSAKL